jgi:hypothetical protein
MKFICEVPNSTIEENLTYNEILDHIEKDNMDIDSDTEQLYKFSCITAHQVPLWTSDKDYKDNPVTCANYAKQHNLLNTAGWKEFKRIADSNKKVERMVHQAKLRSYQRDTFWKFGVLVPRTHAQAIEMDKKNDTPKWQDAEATEMGQLLEYQTFIDKGKGGNVPTGYKGIRCHMIYDVKHNGQHKARLVVG